MLTKADPISATATPAISVIVPVYNVQNYLAEALHSLIQQDFAHPYEIILVEDCSTDSSKAICEEFIATYPGRARLICHTENKGLSVVRNTGIAAVTGAYFTFVDSDDVMPKNALQDLFNAAITHQADIVKGNNLIFDEKGCRPANYNVSKLKVYENAEILSVFLRHKETRGHTWGKLFRSAAFAHIFNTPGVTMAQDALYCVEIFAIAKKLVLIDTTVYHYRLRKSGATGRKFQTGAYLWWLYSIENCGRFVSTAQQKAHYKALQIRTLLQLVREARSLATNQLPQVLQEIHARQESWELTNLRTLVQQRLGIEALVHFIKLSLTLHKLDRRLQHTAKRKQVHSST